MPRCFAGLLAKPLVAKSNLAVEEIGFGRAKELSDVLISPGLGSISGKRKLNQVFKILLDRADAPAVRGIDIQRDDLTSEKSIYWQNQFVCDTYFFAGTQCTCRDTIFGPHLHSH